MAQITLPMGRCCAKGFESFAPLDNTRLPEVGSFLACGWVVVVRPLPPNIKLNLPLTDSVRGRFELNIRFYDFPAED